ncbi:MAG TPA: trigger factor [Verrucomicrobiales bacterium]|jgi:trigger factor|nr:trigger factor [Verrucomicrobiales bacterium]
MNITVEKLPNCMASVRVEVPGDTRKAEREKIVKNYTQHAALPGFRKGKAPRTVVERKFASEIDREVTDRLLNEGLDAAVKKENLKVLSVGNFKPAEDNDESRYAFSLEVVLAPDVTLPDYKGLSITVPKREVTDETVEKTIQTQRERMADLVEVDRPVQMGDFISMDYTATVDGEPVKDKLPEAQAFIADNKGYMVKVDEGSFLPKFCAQLVGMNKGETREVKAEIAEENVHEAIAGKELTYTVTVTEIKEPVLAELNDEFAAKLVPGKTLEEVRGIIRENLTATTQQKDLEQKRIAAMVALRDKVEFELPGNVVFNATQRRVNQLVKMNLDRGITQDMIVENEQDIINAANEQAKVDVKDEYILMEIVNKENLTVTQDDMVRRISYIAYTSQTTPDKVVKTLKKNDGLDNLRHSILLGKALDVLVEHANITYEGTAAPDEGEAA